MLYLPRICTAGKRIPDTHFGKRTSYAQTASFSAKRATGLSNVCDRFSCCLHRIIRDETDIKIYIDEEPSDDLLHTGHERQLALFFLDIRDFTPFLEGNLLT